MWDVPVGQHNKIALSVYCHRSGYSTNNLASLLKLFLVFFFSSYFSKVNRRLLCQSDVLVDTSKPPVCKSKRYGQYGPDL